MSKNKNLWLFRVEFEDHNLKQPTREDFENNWPLTVIVGSRACSCLLIACTMCGKFVQLLGNEILETMMEICLLFWRPLRIGICTYGIFFGLYGSDNDLNVLDRSPLIHNMLTSEAHNMSSQVNMCDYDWYYLLIDEIYPE